MELSKRLNAVANLVTEGSRLADIGTDHGYIPITLIQEQKIPHAIAMDINQGPLLRAKEHIAAEGLQDQIETRLSDGLEKLIPGEADCAVIAGMGGGLTIKILEEGREQLASLKELVLQPQSELKKVRRWLAEHELRIIDEKMVLEDGKYYPMMKVVHGVMTLDGEVEALYGPILLQKKHSCLSSYLDWEAAVKRTVLEQLEQTAGEAAQKRKAQIEQELNWNQEARSRISLA